MPIPGGPVLLLDAGASVEVRPEHLVQFAYMGAGFMEAVVGIERPSVGLLSVGEESGKGTPNVLTAHDRIAEAGALNFVGNVEGFDIPTAGVDVVVADGFTGNVALKVLESTLKAVGTEIRSRIRSGVLSSLGGLLVRGKLGDAARGPRPREGRRRDPAGAAETGRRGARKLRPDRHRARGEAGPPSGGRGHGGPHHGGAPGRGSLAVRERC